MSKITTGTYYITDNTSKERWKLIVRTTDYKTGYATCDWQNMSTGFIVRDRTDSIMNLVDFYNNSDWSITREPELPEDLFNVE